MCLNLGGGGNLLKPVVDPITDLAKNYRTYLMVCCAFNVILGFMYCWVSVMTGIYSMITASFLACSIASVNYCCLAMYMIYITMGWFTNVCTIGLLIQTGSFTAAFSTGNSSVTY